MNNNDRLEAPAVSSSYQDRRQRARNCAPLSKTDSNGGPCYMVFHGERRTIISLGSQGVDRLFPAKSSVPLTRFASNDNRRFRSGSDDPRLTANRNKGVVRAIRGILSRNLAEPGVPEPWVRDQTWPAVCQQYPITPETPSEPIGDRRNYNGARFRRRLAFLDERVVLSGFSQRREKCLAETF